MPACLTPWRFAKVFVAAKWLSLSIFASKKPPRNGEVFWVRATHQARTDDLRVTNALLYRLS